MWPFYWPNGHGTDHWPIPTSGTNSHTSAWPIPTVGIFSLFPSLPSPPLPSLLAQCAAHGNTCLRFVRRFCVAAAVEREIERERESPKFAPAGRRVGLRNLVIIVLCGRRAGGEREGGWEGKCSKISESCLVLKIIVSVEEEEDEKVEKRQRQRREGESTVSWHRKCKEKKRGVKRIMGWFWTLLFRANGLAGYVIIQRQTLVRTVRRRKILKGKENKS